MILTLSILALAIALFVAFKVVKINPDLANPVDTTPIIGEEFELTEIAEPEVKKTRKPRKKNTK